MKKRALALQKYDECADDALSLITESIELIPKSSLFLTTRALMFEKLGELDLAHQDLELCTIRNTEVPYATRVAFARLLYKQALYLDCEM